MVLTPQQRERFKRRECIACGKKGHFVKQCPTRRNRYQIPQRRPQYNNFNKFKPQPKPFNKPFNKPNEKLKQVNAVELAEMVNASLNAMNDEERQQFYQAYNSTISNKDF